jgi:type II secretory pathway pseudopilin PulG
MYMSFSIKPTNKYLAMSLMETILVLGLFAVIATMAIPVGLNQLKRETSKSQASELLSNIFLMQQNSYSGKDSGEFGVFLEEDHYTLYEGPDYSNALWTFVVDFTDGATIDDFSLSGGGQEVHFSQNLLEPNVFGTVGINSIYQLSINTEGSLDLETL